MKATLPRQRFPKSAPAMQRGHVIGAHPPSISRQVFSIPILSRCACGGNCPTCQEKSRQRAGIHISQPSDFLEREADDVAGKIMRMTGATTIRPGEAGIERKCARGGTPRLMGECKECSEKKRLGLQTKLEVSEPGDIYEQEADRIADQVMAAPSHRAANGAPLYIQRFSEQSNGHRVAAPASVDQALVSPGRPLELKLRQNMEQRFGHDFSMVRVHSGAAAGQSARAVNAAAYTVGGHIVFGAGQYAPGTTAGRRLLAHELTHVVQQESATGPQLLSRFSLSPDDFNALAEELHTAMAGQSPDVPLIDVTLQKLERDSKAIQSLRATYRTRYSSDLEAEIRKRLTGQELALACELLGIAPTGGAVIASSAPSSPSELNTAAGRLNAAMTGTSTDERAIYATLLPLSRNATLSMQLKSAYQRTVSRPLEDDLRAKLSGTKLAYALYLLNAPPPAATRGTFQITPGTGKGPATPPPAVEGGQVSALAGVEYSTSSGATASLSFAVTYTGALAPETRWLQFIWREIEVTAADGKKSMLSDSVTIGSRTYLLTTNSSSPNYSVDSRSTSDPFYEASTSTARREPNLTMIGDAPTPIMSLVAREYAAGAKNVVSRAHFELYLIRDYRTLYHIGVDVEHPFRDAVHHGTNRKIRVTELVSALPAPLQKALVQDYPTFGYIQ